MRAMAGLSSDQVDQLVADVYARGTMDPGRRRTVGPYRAVLVATGYRGLLDRFPMFLDTITELEIYRTS